MSNNGCHDFAVRGALLYDSCLGNYSLSVVAVLSSISTTTLVADKCQQLICTIFFKTQFNIYLRRAGLIAWSVQPSCQQQRRIIPRPMLCECIDFQKVESYRSTLSDKPAWLA